MEADWSVALAADDPVVVVPWAACEAEGSRRFVDLRGNLNLIDSIAEAQASPPLRNALLVLNSPDSPWLTAKCDAWVTTDEPRDAYEMDAAPEDTAFIAGSYIDLMARDPEFGGSFPRQEEWLRRITARLRAARARASRVDLILRHAEVEGRSGFAVSWFVEGCGASATVAEQNWANALTLSQAVLIESFQTDSGGRYNGHTGE
jgi:hypothetical protein